MWLSLDALRAATALVRLTVCARTAGLLACTNECSFWRSQNERQDASRAGNCGALFGHRARQVDAHDAIRQSPEQAGRPAVRACTTFPIDLGSSGSQNPSMPLAARPARTSTGLRLCRAGGLHPSEHYAQSSTLAGLLTQDAIDLRPGAAQVGAGVRAPRGCWWVPRP